MRRIVSLWAVCFLCAGIGLFAADQAKVVSGREVGAITPSFVVLDVTGPHKGEAICYVCEYRGAPTILGFFQESGEETARLITKMNELAQKEQKKDLKAVAVMISGPENKEWLEQLAKEKGIKIPLVVFRKGKSDLNMKLYKLNPEAKNTFLVATNREVAVNLTNVNDASFGQVADAAAKVLSVPRKAEPSQP